MSITFVHETIQREVDEDGNMHILYPRTSSSNVVLGNNKSLDDVLENIPILSTNNPFTDEKEESEDEIIINADRLEGYSVQDILNLVEENKPKEDIEEDNGEISVVDKPKPDSIIYTDSNGEYNYLEKPSEDSILICKDNVFSWISLTDLKDILLN